MNVVSAAVPVGPRPYHGAAPPEAELARLRAQVALLTAERAALWWAVGHDELTGLANRRLLSLLAPLLLGTGRPAAVVVLDLDGFKPINDTFGHATGDRVLQVIGERLAAIAGEDLAARLGGDEFACLLTSPHLDAPAHWWRPVVTALAAAVAEPVPMAGLVVSVTASIGVAEAHDGVPLRELLRRADLAMYHAKLGSGGGTRGRRPVDTSTVHVYGHDTGDGMSVPTCDPYRRDPTTVAPASTYLRDDPVWVYRDGSWRPGVVDGASSRAVLVTYRNTQGSGTVVDTVSAECVLTRPATGAQLDRRDSAA